MTVRIGNSNGFHYSEKNCRTVIQNFFIRNSYNIYVFNMKYKTMREITMQIRNGLFTKDCLDKPTVIPNTVIETLPTPTSVYLRKYDTESGLLNTILIASKFKNSTSLQSDETSLQSDEPRMTIKEHTIIKVDEPKLVKGEEKMDKDTTFSTLDNVRDTIYAYEQIRKKLPSGMADEIAHIFSEVGELYQNIRNRETRTKILEELVDVILTTLQIANSMNFTTEKIFKAIEEKKIALDERISVFYKQQRDIE